MSWIRILDRTRTTLNAQRTAHPSHAAPSRTVRLYGTRYQNLQRQSPQTRADPRARPPARGGAGGARGLKP
eukprot:2413739-Prymnesium_polylepis.1